MDEASLLEEASPNRSSLRRMSADGTRLSRLDLPPENAKLPDQNDPGALGTPLLQRFSSRSPARVSTAIWPISAASGAASSTLRSSKSGRSEWSAGSTSGASAGLASFGYGAAFDADTRVRSAPVR